RQRFLTRTVPQREERRQRRSPSPAGGKTDRIARELRRGLLRSGAESLSLANSPQDTCTDVLNAGATGTGEAAGSRVSLPPTHSPPSLRPAFPSTFRRYRRGKLSG